MSTQETNLKFYIPFYAADAENSAVTYLPREKDFSPFIFIEHEGSFSSCYVPHKEFPCPICKLLEKQLTSEKIRSHVTSFIQEMRRSRMRSIERNHNEQEHFPYQTF